MTKNYLEFICIHLSIANKQYEIEVVGNVGNVGNMEGNLISLLFVSGFRVLQTPLTQSTQLPAIREHFQNHHPNAARDGANALHSEILRGFSSGIYGIRRKSNCNSSLWVYTFKFDLIRTVRAMAGT